MRLPIDTSAVTFLVAGPPEPVRDFDTKQPKTDETGAPLFGVQLVILSDAGPDIVSVKLAGQPGPLAVGAVVKVSGLVATPWAMGERSGVSFKATKIEPASNGARHAG